MQKITRFLFFSLCTLTTLYTNTHDFSDTETIKIKMNEIKYAALRAIPGFATYVHHGTHPLGYHTLMNDMDKIATNGNQSVPLISYKTIPLITSRDMTVLSASLISYKIKNKNACPIDLLDRFIKDKMYEFTAYCIKKTVGKQLEKVEKVATDTTAWITKSTITQNKLVKIIIDSDFLQENVEAFKTAAPRAAFDFLLTIVMPPTAPE